MSKLYGLLEARDRKKTLGTDEAPITSTVATWGSCVRTALYAGEDGQLRVCISVHEWPDRPVCNPAPTKLLRVVLDEPLSELTIE